ncbi:hypothetical protein [Microbacterium sp. AK031]|uniref:hypothetical protein n=1 Tax=Microbacterium sp. AK031 TaxID=2723076 RepID=UPI00216A7E38|nr:hypothetical protein [Microbacterium sp. AK031]MCS3842079.1 hypothetical protein [Microbacterium sp. AK031]
MMTDPAPHSSRRGLAITSIVVGAVATLMIIAFWTVGRAVDGQGLTDAAVLVVISFYASVIVGAVAVLLGIAAVVLSRPRLLGVIAIVLGLFPIVAVAVSLATLAV